MKGRSPRDLLVDTRLDPFPKKKASRIAVMNQITPHGTPNPARIVQLRAFHVRIPFWRTVTHASHSRTSSENVVVECRLDNGVVGYGEGVPRDYVTGETIDISMSLLRNVQWDASELVDSFRSFQEVVERCQRFSLGVVEGDDRHCIGNAARCAVEMAVLDAFGQSFAVSIRDLAGYLPECKAIHQPRPACQYGAAITSKPRYREILTALKLRVGMFKQIKVKVGTEHQNDPERLRLFRKLLGRSIDIRIDANESWRGDEAAERIRELMPFQISAVEQPVAHQSVEQLKRVREETSVPIMLDESLCSMIDAERALHGGWCDLFNLRLSKCGGLIRTLELASFAHANGLGYQLGCQVGETGILSAAGRHFACSIRNIRYLEGSYDRYLVRERLIRRDITFGWAGRAPAITGPGLGVAVDPARLARITVSEETLLGSSNE